MMDVRELSSRYDVRRLGAGDIEMIYRLSAGNPLFYRYCPPFVTRESIASDMKALPPRTTYDDKFYIGFFEGDGLIAIMDLILNFPDKETAFIGLFMTDRAVQGRGVGSGIIAECCHLLKIRGYRSVRLAYAKGNPQSEAFWTKNGFVKTGLETDQGEYIAVIMEKKIEKRI